MGHDDGGAGGDVAQRSDGASLDGHDVGTMDAVDTTDDDATTDATEATDASPWSCGAPYEAPTWTRPADDSVAFQSLLEGAGYGSAASSDWVGMAAGDFCGGAEKELVLVKNGHSYFSVLRGPTPYPVGAGDLGSNAAHPWRGVAAADFDGDGRDEIVAVRHVTASGVPDFVIAKAGADCALSVLASASIGGPANSDWLAVAAGDFDGDGTPEIAAVKSAHSNFVLLRYAGSALTLASGTDLDTQPGLAWKALAAGDLDGDGHDELIAVRSAANGQPTVLAYRYGAAGFMLLASSTIGADGNSDWAGVTAGDFNGDGRASIVLAKDTHSNFVLLDLPAGASALATRGSADLNSAAGQPWRGLAAVDWLGGDDGAQELVSLRAATGAYRTDLLVTGSAFHRRMRDTALAHTEAQYAGEPRTSDSTPADVETLKQRLLDTHATVYNFLLWDTLGQDYLDFVRFLDATRDFCVDGRQLRVWVTLIPPTEVSSGRCSFPADSPLTSFSEATYFHAGLGAASCQDYLGWASLLGRLAVQYPQLVAVNIDDFTLNVDDPFTPEVVAEMQSRMRSQAPWLNVVPTFYYAGRAGPVATSLPDIGLGLDSILFYFRNGKQGEGPCASCSTPGSCTSACLAGTCAEATVPHAPGEIADMLTVLDAQRSLQLGAYFTAHSACGEPSARYDYELLETALALPRVAGATVYTTHYPAITCTDSNYLSDKGCVVQRVFANY